MVKLHLTPELRGNGHYLSESWSGRERGRSQGIKVGRKAGGERYHITRQLQVLFTLCPTVPHI